MGEGSLNSSEPSYTTKQGKFLDYYVLKKEFMNNVSYHCLSNMITQQYVLFQFVILG
jgi:hypothetical protein